RCGAASVLSALPYHVPWLTQAAARAALRHADATLGSVALLRAERDRVVATLAAAGYDVGPSEPNLALFWRVARGRDLRAVRPVRRRAAGVAGVPGPRCADPRRGDRAPAAGHDRHAGG